MKRIVKPLLVVLYLVLFVVLLNPRIASSIFSSGVINTWEKIIDDNFRSVANLTWANAAAALLTFLAAAAAAYLVDLIISKLVLKKSRSRSLASLVRSVVKFIVYLVGIVFALNCIGIDMTTILASIGVITVIVGLSADSLIKDFLASVFLILDGKFEVGDYVSIDNFRGKVTSIGLRNTSILDAAGNVKTINNSAIGTVVNLSKADSQAVVEITVDKSVKLEDAEKVFGDAFAELREANPEVFKSDIVYSGVEKLTTANYNLMYQAAVEEEKLYEAKRLMNRAARLVQENL